MKKYLSLFVVTLFIILIFALPLLFFSINSGHSEFSGVHSFINAADSFFQLEVVHQGAAGSSWLAENPYSTEGPAVQRFLIFYTMMGKLAQWSGINWMLLYQLNRILWAGLFVSVLYWFMGLLGLRNKSRLFLLLLVLFSGGLGSAIWPEGNLFLSLYNPPHVAFALCLMLIVLGNYYLWLIENETKNKQLIVASLGLFILGWVHPYDVLSIDIIIITAGCYCWCKDRDPRVLTGSAFLLAAGLLPLGFHFFWSYTQFTGRSFTVDDYPVPLYSLPAFLGLNFIIVVVLGGWFTIKSYILPVITGRDACAAVHEQSSSFIGRYWFLWVWLISGLAMLFIPFYFRRKLFLGVPLAINLLAGVLLIGILQKIVSDRRLKNIVPVFLAGYLVLAAWGNITTVSADIRGMLDKQFPYFIANEEMAAFRWLASSGVPEYRSAGVLEFRSSGVSEFRSAEVLERGGGGLQHTSTQHSGTILCHPDNGSLIPVYSGNKVYAANWLWTSDLERKKIKIRKFFTKGTSNSWRKEFLKANKINYIYYGKWERKISGFDPDGVDYLQKVFDNGMVKIYLVLRKQYLERASWRSKLFG